MLPGGSSLIKGLLVPICAYVIMAVFSESDGRHPRRAEPRTRGLHVSGRLRRQYLQHSDPGKPDQRSARFPLAILIGGLVAGIARARSDRDSRFCVCAEIIWLS